VQSRIGRFEFIKQKVALGPEVNNFFSSETVEETFLGFVAAMLHVLFRFSRQMIVNDFYKFERDIVEALVAQYANRIFNFNLTTEQATNDSRRIKNTLFRILHLKQTKLENEKQKFQLSE
jgi:hypothetical protein